MLPFYSVSSFNFIIADNCFFASFSCFFILFSSSIGHALIIISSKKNACIRTRITVPKLRYINNYALGTTWIYYPSPYYFSKYLLFFSVTFLFRRIIIIAVQDNHLATPQLFIALAMETSRSFLFFFFQ